MKANSVKTPTGVLDESSISTIETLVHDDTSIRLASPTKDEQPQQKTATQPAEPYTTHKGTYRHALYLIVGLATMTSSSTATILLPLLPQMRTQFYVSAQAINLVLIIYVIFQAISPAIFGRLSGHAGRRPVFLIVLGLYVAGSIGRREARICGVCGYEGGTEEGSATFAIAFGVVVDLCVPGDRGSMLGPVDIALNLGTCVGPVVGGYGKVKWAFWAIAIVGAVLLLGVGSFLPETARTLFGNGAEREVRVVAEELWQTGLSYLPRGVGIITGSWFTGKIMNYNYRVTARKAGLTVDKVAGYDLLRFPIERARTRGSYLVLAVAIATMIPYGWAVEHGAHPAVSLVLQFMQRFWGTYFYKTYSALIADVVPHSPSTAAATTSITRCAMAATGLALLQLLLDVMGRGLFFTILGVWCRGLGAGDIWLLQWREMMWRTERSRVDWYIEIPDRVTSKSSWGQSNILPLHQTRC
ncbi:major facilitator superfamily domain-containing protein [Pseudomassariella vexata]|uniref:Major facilitator superfamily domain-containing protein n=1 Tax=Pseudomassariella vexata TaxID=1141098 RepID=A0A1Y2DLZ9_9PEZI|nr:major facilitator superfamily domain-containing protein [Pseudomassariella vexata]ORY60277.1 major facilitator superfamily domain-containing protein [Pseudomassariella vexata]